MEILIQDPLYFFSRYCGFLVKLFGVSECPQQKVIIPQQEVCYCLLRMKSIDYAKHPASTKPHPTSGPHHHPSLSMQPMHRLMSAVQTKACLSIRRPS